MNLLGTNATTCGVLNNLAVPTYVRKVTPVTQIQSTPKNSQDMSGNNGFKQEYTDEDYADVKAKDEEQILNKAIIDKILRQENKNYNRALECSYSVHKETKELLIKVRDKETKEVIREIPSEKILDMVAAMLDAAGLLIDKKV